MAREQPSELEFRRFWQRLQALGLNAYEARSYLVLVGHPRFKALELAARAHVPRQKIYEVLDSLVEKGFARVIQDRTKLWFAGVYPSQSAQVIWFMSTLTCAAVGSEPALKTAATIKTLYLITILRCRKVSLLACRIFQTRHNGFLRMILAPGFHVRDVFLMCDQIDRGLAKLVAEPTTHPRREITRLCRRHTQILAACNAAHIDG